MEDQEIPGVKSTTRLYRQAFGGEQPTIRDQFAMAVAQGELAAQSRDWGGYPPGDEALFAERVWRLTDALLAARDRK